MKIIITESGIKFSSVMKLVFFGYIIGMGIIMIPVAFLDIINLKEFTNSIIALVIIPLILLLQGIFLGLLINLGLYIFKKFKPIEVEHEKQNQHL